MPVVFVVQVGWLSCAVVAADRCSIASFAHFFFGKECSLCYKLSWLSSGVNGLGSAAVV